MSLGFDFLVSLVGVSLERYPLLEPVVVVAVVEWPNNGVNILFSSFLESDHLLLDHWKVSISLMVVCREKIENDYSRIFNSSKALALVCIQKIITIQQQQQKKSKYINSRCHLRTDKWMLLFFQNVCLYVIASSLQMECVSTCCTVPMYTSLWRYWYLLVSPDNCKKNVLEIPCAPLLSLPLQGHKVNVKLSRWINQGTCIWTREFINHGYWMWTWSWYIRGDYRYRLL